MSQENPPPLAFGYALQPKKIKTFITQSLLTHALNHQIHFIQIHPTKPLLEQGPFHAIIHKLYDPDWNSQLTQFSNQNPSVLIVDSPDSIDKLRNRVSMFDVVERMIAKRGQDYSKIKIPKQLVVVEEGVDCLGKIRDLKFPVIAKALDCDGSVNAHKMSLVLNEKGLRGVEFPVVLQEFVNHGGVLFKVYVVGEYVKCVKRGSLSDVNEEELGVLGDVVSFSQISKVGSGVGKVGGVEVEMPEEGFVVDVARGLREGLGLSLFNFDMIRDGSGCYYVIDINYFPGYAQMPGYEAVFTDFLRGIVNEKSGSGGSTEL